MINSVSNASTAYAMQIQASKTQQQTPTKHGQQEDSVHLSAQAKAAAASQGVDHDGDSH